MNREIKFRAWDLNNKKMYSSYMVDENGNFCVNGDFTNNCECSEEDKVIQMQFTGKKDKKGKEIYEGDIIRVKEHPDFPVWGGIGFVFWDNEEQSYFYGVEDGWSDLLCTPEEKQLEVVGNIYENPELLEEQK